jgi:hypothetical protein
VELVSVDKESYAIGDPVVFKVLVTNTSRMPVPLPWCPDPEVVADEFWKGLTETASISLEIRDSGAGRPVQVQGTVLVGSETEPTTLEVIYPGETARLRLRGTWAAVVTGDENGRLRGFENHGTS